MSIEKAGCILGLVAVCELVVRVGSHSFDDSDPVRHPIKEPVAGPRSPVAWIGTWPNQSSSASGYVIVISVIDDWKSRRLFVRKRSAPDVMAVAKWAASVGRNP